MRNIQSNKEEVAGRVQKIILALIHDVSKIQFFHTKRKNNEETDREATKGYRLKQGEILINIQCLHAKCIPCFHL